MKRVPILLAFALAAFSLAGGAAAADAKKPALALKTLDGKSFDLASERGKWVIVNFWATWCSPCLKELPDISAFVAAHKDNVVAIGLDFEEAEKDDITKFLKSHPIGYPIALLVIVISGILPYVWFKRRGWL